MRVVVAAAAVGWDAIGTHASSVVDGHDVEKQEGKVVKGSVAVAPS